MGLTSEQTCMHRALSPLKGVLASAAHHRKASLPTCSEERPCLSCVVSSSPLSPGGVQTSLPLSRVSSKAEGKARSREHCRAARAKHVPRRSPGHHVTLNVSPPPDRRSPRPPFCPPRKTMERCFLLAAASALALLVLLGEPLNLPSFVIFPTECGERPALDEIIAGTRIVGGRDAEVGAWPWQISLQVYQFGKGYNHVCGGSLINNNVVVTAAHCVNLVRDPELWRVVIGIHRLDRYQSQMVMSRVSAITIHSDYGKNSFENDIALLKLIRTIEYSDYIQPICLPKASVLVTRMNSCYVTGWGLTKDKGRSRHILQEAQVKIVPEHICKKWYGEKLTRNMVCAGSESGNTCQGDSGGPLMCHFPNATNFYLIGITSFGTDCGLSNESGVFTLVPKYRRWLELHLNSRKTTCVSIPHVLIFWTVVLVTLFLVL
ncbi:elastase-1-like [Tiliqua scincoides]|uniref:elastase-1-like n=1 Tax=Tiliqua scincoides TaxID=71010 RepID=UPI003462F3E5